MSMMMNRKLLLLGAISSVLLATVVIAAPQGNVHHDVKKSHSSEFGSDDEVRQLLDLKSLTVPGEEGNAGEASSAHITQTSDNEQAETKANKAIKGGNGKQMKSENAETSGDKQDVNKDENASSGTKTLADRQQPDHLFDDNHHQLKRQEISKPRHVRYTPLDLALYVYKTGDEEGVTLAIQELIAEGLMTAEEALEYLREIRENLHYLNQRDEQEQMQGEEEEISGNVMKSLMKKNSLPLPLTEMNLADPEAILTPEVDYENILERLRGGQDYVTTEYSLEDVIYQLAKILFKQALHREGDMGSEKALQEVAALLEKETARGAITPEVEKKVLDVMVNSLVDSIGENEVPTGPGPMLGGSNFKLGNQSPFSLGSSSTLNGASNFKPTTDLFQLTKSTTKRDTHQERAIKKVTEEKN